MTHFRFTRCVCGVKMEANLLRIQDCWKTMLQGNDMLKLSVGKTRQRKIQKRHFYLENDMSRIRYKATKKLGKQIESASILEVVDGESLKDIVRSYRNDLAVDCSLSLKLKTGRDVILVAPSQDVAKKWCLGLRQLVENKQNDPRKNKGREDWLRSEFHKLAKKCGASAVPFQEIFNFLLTLGQGLETRPVYLKKMATFKRSRRAKVKGLDADEFVAFINAACTRDYAVSLFKSLSSNGEVLTAADVEYFLTCVQCVTDVTQEACERLIEEYEFTEQGRERKELGVEGLTKYLLSKEGDIFNNAHVSVYQDMTQPLNHYFIASSHNTYLMRDQFSGESSVQAYIDALNKGYRCVEIDCYDGKDDEPVVYHGHTLTSEVAFKDVVMAIKENAFLASSFPVIITIENHCSVEGQKRMARHLQDILGDMLFKEGVDSSHVALPSPEFFKNKILIRGKKLKSDVATFDKVDSGHISSDVSSSEESEDERDVKEMLKGKDKVDPAIEKQMNDQENKKRGDQRETKGKENLVPRIVPRVEIQKQSRNDQENMKKENQREMQTGKEVKLKDEEEERVDAIDGMARRTLKPPRADHRKKKIALEFSQLINYITNSKFKSFELATTMMKFYHSSSFSETKLDKLLRENAVDFVEFNKRNMSRIYPSGTRVASSNYNPQQAWNAGSQIVAINQQTHGEPVDLYLGRFRQNGRAGYNLKPTFLRDLECTFDPNTTSEVTGIESKVLRVTVISGQQLPRVVSDMEIVKDEPDPYVLTYIHGIPADTFSHKTHTVTNNGLDPKWGDSFQKKLLVPELAMIRFCVVDEDPAFDDFIGQFSLPFTSLRPGFRHVHLLNKQGEQLTGASLFVHIELLATTALEEKSLDVGPAPKSECILI